MTTLKKNNELSFDLIMKDGDCNFILNENNFTIEFTCNNKCETETLIVTVSLNQQIFDTLTKKVIELNFNIFTNFANSRLRVSTNDPTIKSIKLSKGKNEITKLLFPTEQLIFYFSELPKSGKIDLFF